MTRSVIAVLVGLAFLSAAGAEDNPIAARMAAFTEAYNKGDAAAIAAFYTEDGAVLPPQGAALVGRQKISDHYAQAFGRGVGNLRYKILEIRQLGPAAAVEIGEAQVSAGDQTILSRSMHVWLLRDGTWALSRDMYHVLAVAR